MNPVNVYLRRLRCVLEFSLEIVLQTFPYFSTSFMPTNQLTIKLIFSSLLDCLRHTIKLLSFGNAEHPEIREEGAED